MNGDRLVMKPAQELLAFARRDVRLVRLGSKDVKADTDHVRALRNCLLACEPSYPGIESWYEQKVLPGITADHRAAYLAYVGSGAVGVAIVKLGLDAKLCHLRVHDQERQNHLGELFIALLASELRGVASSVHFTIPESVWSQTHRFFEGFGFARPEPNDVQYRRGDPELRCATTFTSLWRGVATKLPGLLAHYEVEGARRDASVLLSVRPRWAELILAGTKRVEIRRRFSSRWIGHRASLYATSPVQSLVGDVHIASVLSGPPDQIWRELGPSIGCSEGEFAEYAGDRGPICGVVLERPRRFPRPIKLAELQEALGRKLHPPQSYGALHAGSEWAKAVSLAALC